MGRRLQAGRAASPPRGPAAPPPQGTIIRIHRAVSTFPNPSPLCAQRAAPHRLPRVADRRLLQRVARADTPVHFAPAQEAAITPDVTRIVQAARRAMEYAGVT